MTLAKNSDLIVLFQDSFKLMAQHGIRRFVIAPLLINFLFFSLMLTISIHFFHQLQNWLIQLIPHWLHWLEWILWPLFLVFFFVIFIYTFNTFANIFAAPFNSLLSEKVEFYLTGNTLPAKNLKTQLLDLPRGMLRQCQVLLYYLPRAFCLLLLFFIPLVQVIAPFIWLLFSAWYLSLQYFDYPADNHQVSFTELKKILKTKRTSNLAFGIIVFILLSIPVINFICMPLAIIAATKIWAKELKIL